MFRRFNTLNVEIICLQVSVKDDNQPINFKFDRVFPADVSIDEVSSYFNEDL